MTARTAAGDGPIHPHLGVEPGPVGEPTAQVYMRQPAALFDVIGCFSSVDSHGPQRNSAQPRLLECVPQHHTIVHLRDNRADLGGCRWLGRRRVNHRHGA